MRDSRTREERGRGWRTIRQAAAQLRAARQLAEAPVKAGRFAGRSALREVTAPARRRWREDQENPWRGRA